MPHLFIACLSTETNTFSPIPTGLGGYEEYCLRHGDATTEPPILMTESLHLWRARAEALGWNVTESLTAIAEPAGLTSRATYAAFKAEILADLAAAPEADVILLSLHGAMVADGCEDCEADLTAAIRSARPGAHIGVSLDLHVNLSQALLDAADVIVTFKEYPHDDATPRAAELFDLIHRAVQGEIVPHMALFDCRMMGLYLTKEGAMREFVAQMQASEGQASEGQANKGQANKGQGGLLSVSLAHGFPWGDVADVGARMLVVAEDAARAMQEAERLGRAFFALRHEVTAKFPDLDTALTQAAQSSKPVVLADMSDNPGAGAPGDATHVLAQLRARRITNVALGLIYDPIAVQMCFDAGEGAQFTLRIGGKLEAASGQPLDLDVTVMALEQNCGQHLGEGLEPMGRGVWLRLEGEVDIVLNDVRVQVYAPEAFTQLGIDLSTKDLIVVKSLFHFYGAFKPIAGEVIFCATPGRVNPNLEGVHYTRRTLPYWPAVEDPWA
ncbi:M81 family metallopeptidase [Roseobacteraceae bacterium S113]